MIRVAWVAGCVQITADMYQERANRILRMAALEYTSHVESLVMAPYLGEVVDGIMAKYMPSIFAWFFYKFDQVRRMGRPVCCQPVKYCACLCCLYCLWPGAAGHGVQPLLPATEGL